MNKSKKGFTLIELLLVIAILAVLAVAVFVALNPAQRFKDTRDARRNTDVETILTAIHSYIVDNKGALPTGLTAGMVNKQLGTATSGCSIVGCGVAGATDCVDLSTPMAKYLKSMPIDPNSTASAGLTQYAVQVDANGIVTVKACSAESGSVSASR